MGDEQIPNDPNKEEVGASFPSTDDTTERELDDDTQDADRTTRQPDLLDDNPQGAPSSEQN